MQLLHLLLCFCDPFMVPFSPLLTNLCVCLCVVCVCVWCVCGECTCGESVCVCVRVVEAGGTKIIKKLASILSLSSFSLHCASLTLRYIVVRTDGYGSLMDTTVLHSHLPMFMCFAYPLPCNISSSHDLFMLFISFLTDLHTFGHPHFFIMFLAFFFYL